MALVRGTQHHLVSILPGINERDQLAELELPVLLRGRRALHHPRLEPGRPPPGHHHRVGLDLRGQLDPVWRHAGE